MKTAAVIFLLALSLAANLHLARRLLRPVRPAVEENRVPASSSERSRDACPVPGESWVALRGEGDLAVFVGNLRSAGYPPYIVRALVTSALSQRDAARTKKLSPLFPYWGAPRPTSAQQAAQRAFNRERAQEMDALLGPDATPDYGPQVDASRTEIYGDLPPEKIVQLERIARDYGDLMTGVYAEARGLMLAEDRERLAYLAMERQKDIARVLTPEELEEYMMRTSDTAFEVREQFIAADLTREEFRTAYRLQADYEARIAALSPNPEAEADRTAAREGLQEEFRALLGPERSVLYDRSADGKYRGVFILTGWLGLPQSAANTVYQIRDDTERRAAALGLDPTLAPEQRQARLTALASETDAAIARTLGPRGHAAYQEAFGKWLRSIASATGTASKTTSATVAPVTGIP